MWEERRSRAIGDRHVSPPFIVGSNRYKASHLVSIALHHTHVYLSPGEIPLHFLFVQTSLHFSFGQAPLHSPPRRCTAVGPLPFPTIHQAQQRVKLLQRTPWRCKVRLQESPVGHPFADFIYPGRTLSNAELLSTWGSTSVVTPWTWFSSFWPSAVLETHRTPSAMRKSQTNVLENVGGRWSQWQTPRS